MKKPGYTQNRFGDFLVERNILSREEIESIIKSTETQGLKVGQSLVMTGKMSPSEVLENLARFFQIPLLKKLTPNMISKNHMNDWSESFIRNSGVLILDLDKVLDDITIPKGEAIDAPDSLSCDLVIGLVFPERYDVIQRIERQYPDKRLCFVLLPPDQFSKIADMYYGGGDLSSINEGIFASTGPDETEGAAKATLKGILQYAINNNVTDIHISPVIKSKGFLVRVRINGELHEYIRSPSYSREQYDEIVAYIKIFAGIPVDQKLTPQDGGWSERIGDKSVNIRVATTPTAYGRVEKITLRLLNKSVGDSLEALEFTPSIISSIDRSISNPYGLILVTGPTGSGKTTTIYSMLKRLDREKKKVYTIEDPVEYYLDNTTQIQLHPSQGMTFPAILRSLLRHDPDIVFVGEIRDEETAMMAMRLAMTGHLVLSTLHTNNATEAIPRLEAMGVPLYMLSGSLLGVGAQRLVKVMCPYCKEPYIPSDFEREVLCLPDDPSIQYYHSPGCGRCRGTGTIARRAVLEFADLQQIFNWEKEIAGAGAYGATLRHLLVNQYGMRTMYMDTLRLMAEGIVSPETAVYSVRPDHVDKEAIKSGKWKELIKEKSE